MDLNNNIFNRGPNFAKAQDDGESFGSTVEEVPMVGSNDQSFGFTAEEPAVSENVPSVPDYAFNNESPQTEVAPINDVSSDNSPAFNGDNSQSFGYTSEDMATSNDNPPQTNNPDFNSDGSSTYGYTSEQMSADQGSNPDYNSDGSQTFGFTAEGNNGAGSDYQSDRSQTYGYTSESENAGNPPPPDYDSDGSSTFGYTAEQMDGGQGSNTNYNSDGTETFGYTAEQQSGQVPQYPDGSETFGYTSEQMPTTTQVNPPGSVVQNPVFQPTQAPVPAPVPGVTPSRNFYVDYECIGTSQVFFQFFSDGTRQPTGRRVDNSTLCGFVPRTAVSTSPTQTTSSTSSRSSSSARGGNANVSVNLSQPGSNPSSANVAVASPSTRFPVLSTSCTVTPTNPRVGDEVTWRAIPSGGSSNFNFNWIGGNAPLPGMSGNPVTVTYNTEGVKTGEVRVFDNVTREVVFATCSVDVAPRGNVSPTPTPVTTTTPIPTPTAVTSMVRCPEGTTERSRSAIEVVCERTTSVVTTASMAATCPQGTVEKSRSVGQLICERQTATTTTAQSISAASPTERVVVTDRNVAAAPAGVIYSSPGTTTTVPSPQIIEQAPSSVKELPKTGLPLAGVGLGSLLPLGLRLKRLVKGQAEIASGSTIWLERQLKL